MTLLLIYYMTLFTALTLLWSKSDVLFYWKKKKKRKKKKILKMHTSFAYLSWTLSPFQTNVIFVCFLKFHTGHYFMSILINIVQYNEKKNIHCLKSDKIRQIPQKIISQKLNCPGSNCTKFIMAANFSKNIILWTIKVNISLNIIWNTKELC